MAGLSRREKRRKLALEEDKRESESGAMKSAIRSAKKAMQPRPINMKGKGDQRAQSQTRKPSKKKSKNS
jgi:ATP-dependent RNA helicase DDX27